MNKEKTSGKVNLGKLCEAMALLNKVEHLLDRVQQQHEMVAFRQARLLIREVVDEETEKIKTIWAQQRKAREEERRRKEEKEAADREKEKWIREMNEEKIKRETFENLLRNILEEEISKFRREWEKEERRRRMERKQEEEERRRFMEQRARDLPRLNSNWSKIQEKLKQWEEEEKLAKAVEAHYRGRKPAETPLVPQEEDWEAEADHPSFCLTRSKVKKTWGQRCAACGARPGRCNHHNEQ